MDEKKGKRPASRKLKRKQTPSISKVVLDEYDKRLDSLMVYEGCPNLKEDE